MPVKGKGSEFERQICKRLSKWWTDEERDDVFWRSQTSGARATTRGKSGLKTFGQYGDIQACDPCGQTLLDVFTIEVKRGYSSACICDMLDKPDSAAQKELDKFIEQVQEDTRKAGSLYWMVIWQRNRRQPVVVTSFRICRNLPQLKKVPHLRGKLRMNSGKCQTLFSCTLEDFLSLVTRNDVECMTIRS